MLFVLFLSQPALAAVSGDVLPVARETVDGNQRVMYNLLRTLTAAQSRYQKTWRLPLV